MGYTQFWTRPVVIRKEQFNMIVAEFRKLLLPLEQEGVFLCEGSEKFGPPILTDDLVKFVGKEMQSETFQFPIVYQDPIFHDAYFSDDFCATGRGCPTDLAVTCFLIIAKHVLKNRIRIRGDGDDKEWMPAKKLCQQHLGYGVQMLVDNSTDNGDLRIRW